MRDKTFLVKIILPSQVVFEKNATMVNVPGSEGVIGILPGHMKLVSTIKPGIINVFFDGQKKTFFTHEGIAEINGEEVNIVSEFIVAIEEQKKDQILNKISSLESELESSESDSIKATTLRYSIARYKSLLDFVSN